MTGLVGLQQARVLSMIVAVPICQREIVTATETKQTQSVIVGATANRLQWKWESAMSRMFRAAPIRMH